MRKPNVYGFPRYLRPLPHSLQSPLGVKNARHQVGEGDFIATLMPQCIKCGGPLNQISYRSVKYCSYFCQKNYLKSQYRKRNPHKLKEWKVTYYSGGTYLPQKNKDEALKYFDNRCNRCSTTEDLVVHHVKPMRHGGGHDDRNLMVLCSGCHQEWHLRMRGDFWNVAEREEATDDWDDVGLVGDAHIEDLEEMPPNPSDVLLYLEKIEEM